jgi:hypothetical protein
LFPGWIIILLSESVIDSAIGIDEGTPADMPGANLCMMLASAMVWLIKQWNSSAQRVLLPGCGKINSGSDSTGI